MLWPARLARASAALVYVACSYTHLREFAWGVDLHREPLLSPTATCNSLSFWKDSRDSNWASALGSAGLRYCYPATRGTFLLVNPVITANRRKESCSHH